jgi:uncharacterized membrane protein
MRKYLLSITIYVIVITIINALHKIAYDESIFKTWWNGAILVIVCLIFAEIVAEKVTRK